MHIRPGACVSHTQRSILTNHTSPSVVGSVPDFGSTLPSVPYIERGSNLLRRVYLAELLILIGHQIDLAAAAFLSPTVVVVPPLQRGINFWQLDLVCQIIISKMISGPVSLQRLGAHSLSLPVLNNIISPVCTYTINTHAWLIQLSSPLTSDYPMDYAPIGEQIRSRRQVIASGCDRCLAWIKPGPCQRWRTCMRNVVHHCRDKC